MIRYFLIFALLFFSGKIFSQGKVIAAVNDSTELQQFDDGTQIKVSYFFNGNGVSLKDKDNLLAKGGVSYQQEFNIKNVGKEIIGEVNFLLADYDLPAKKELHPQTLDMLTNLKGVYFPAFSWRDINGNEFSTESLKGKTVVLNFWHTSCIPCIAEIPVLNTLAEKYENKNVVFIASSPNEKTGLNKFLIKNTFKYIQVAETDPNKIFTPMPGWPIHIVIDSNGIIQFAALGKQNGLEEKLSKSIDESLHAIK
ncbi:TlpA family protein disulfide reductase [Ferruginibacter profundus]